jgi:nitrogen fixation/metabolism regulation signal transduction histidine kinase
MVLLTIVALQRTLDRLVLRRIKRLGSITDAIRGGNLEERADVKGNDELSQLAVSFNMMTASLKESLSEVQRHKDYLESVINNIEDQIVVVDRNLARLYPICHRVLQEWGAQTKCRYEFLNVWRKADIQIIHLAEWMRLVYLHFEGPKNG